jgi:hypothetical protein
MRCGEVPARTAKVLPVDTRHLIEEGPCEDEEEDMEPN